MKLMQKTVILTALLAVSALPLAGCSNTWHGMKSDMSAMSDSVSNTVSSMHSSNDAAPAPAAEPMQVKPSQGPATYNN